MIYKQSVAKKIGEEGCYFLCLVYLAEKIMGCEYDVIGTYDTVVKSKWMEEDCYIKDPEAIFAFLSGKKYTVRKEEPGYTPKDEELEISRYELKETGKSWAHFVVTRNGSVLYDPLGESRTVSLGGVASKRILKPC